MKTIRKEWPRVRQYVKAGNTYFSVDLRRKHYQGQKWKNFTSRDKALEFASHIGKKVATSGVEPLKTHWAELRKQLAETETQIRDLDPSWKPASFRPKADAKIAEILTANERPMTVEEILAAVGNTFTKWKVKSTLKRKSTGAKAVFSLADGRYSLKAAA
jgi:hypothetical protein